LISPEKLHALYATMVKCNLALESAGLSKRGAGCGEAAYAASATDLGRGDTLHATPQHALARLARGAVFSRSVAELERAARTRTGAEAQLAVGCEAAQSHKRAKKGRVAMVFAGDAEATAGAWKKALTLAARRGLPILFISLRSAGEAPAFLDTEAVPVEAMAFGVPLITVDGNDAVAVYRVAYESLTRARQLSNPTLIDCVCDGADGIAAMETWLSTRGLLTPAKKRSIRASVRAGITARPSSASKSK
jgi:TPP-dependent pyruvate/acetoin dehydrogenase alpha subunit